MIGAKEEKQERCGKDKNAVFGCCNAANGIHEARREDTTDSLRSSESSFLTDQQHDEHGWRRNDISLRQPFQKSQLEHPPP